MDDYDAFQKLHDAQAAFYQAVLESIEPILLPLIIHLTRGIEWLTKHL